MWRPLLPLLTAFASVAGAWSQTNAPEVVPPVAPLERPPFIWTLGGDEPRGLGAFSGAWDGETLVEPPPAGRAWWLGTDSYNTLLVDGQGQDPARNFDLMEARSVVGSFHVSGMLGLAQAYPQPDLTLSRYFAINTNTQELVVVDVLRSATNRVLSSLLHTSASVAEVEGTLLFTGASGCLRISAGANVAATTAMSPDPVAALPPDEPELRDYRLALESARRRATGPGAGLKSVLLQALAFERPAGVVIVERPGALGTTVQHWSQKAQALSSPVAVPRTGFYRMLFKYSAPAPVPVTVEMDQRPLFRGMKPVVLPAPAAGTNAWAFLTAGEHNEPDGYLLYLEEGEHVLTLTHGGGGELTLDYVLLHPAALTREAALASCNDTDGLLLQQQGERLRVSRVYEAAQRVVAVTAFVPAPTWRQATSKWKRPRFLTPDAAPPELGPPPQAVVSVADDVASVDLPVSKVRLRIEADGMRVRFKQVTTEKGGAAPQGRAGSRADERSP